MRKPLLLLLAIVLLIGGLAAIKLAQRPPPPQFAPSLTQPEAAPVPAAASTRPRDALPPFLPPEARRTLALIQQGGPYPHRQDGSVFGNREQRLPQRPRGYYREYTVDTPGAGNRARAASLPAATRRPRGSIPTTTMKPSAVSTYHRPGAGNDT